MSPNPAEAWLTYWHAQCRQNPNIKIESLREVEQMIFNWIQNT